MSRITDKPIPTNEPTISAEQISETESIQKTGNAGKAPIDTEHSAGTLQPASPEDAREQMYESRLGGVARQAELQSQFPMNPSPELKALPDELHPNLDPNVHLNETVDVTKNLPGGHTIESGLAGMTDLSGKGIKSGPNHMGVSLTTGGMKAPTDVIADILNTGKLGETNTSAPKPQQGKEEVSKSVDGGGVKADSISGGSHSTPPSGVQLGARAPKWNLISGESGGAGNTSSEDLKAFAGIADKPAGPTAKEQIEAKKEAMSAGSDKAHQDWLKKTSPDGGTKKMTDPDAGGGTTIGTQMSPEDLARLIAVRGGDTDFVRGHEGPVNDGDKPPVRYRDLVTDPGDEDHTSVATAGSGAGIIPGGGYTDPPRPDLNPDGVPPQGGNDPNGNPS